MEIIVDEKQDLVDLDEDTEFEDAIQDINEWLMEYGYVLETFTLDGEEAWKNWQNQIGDRPIGDFDRLEVEVMEPRSICVDTLDELVPHFEDLKESLEKVTEMIQQGKKEEGFEKLNTILAHLQQYINTIEYVVNITGVDLTGLEVDQQSLTEHVHELRSITNRAEGAVKDEDMVSLSDMTGYELKPMVDSWIEACGKIREKVCERWETGRELEPMSRG